VDDTALAAWTADLAAELGVEQALDVDTVLKLAADAAHAVMRPAAPVTTFLVGLAIGEAGGDPDRVAEVLAGVQRAIDRQTP
jgi:hypothetical protein